MNEYKRHFHCFQHFNVDSKCASLAAVGVDSGGWRRMMNDGFYAAFLFRRSDRTIVPDAFSTCYLGSYGSRVRASTLSLALYPVSSKHIPAITLNF